MSWLDEDAVEEDEDDDEHSWMGLFRKLSLSVAIDDDMNVQENEVGIFAIAFGDEQLDELMLLDVSMPLSVDSTIERCVNEWGMCLFILMNCLAWVLVKKKY